MENRLNNEDILQNEKIQSLREFLIEKFGSLEKNLTEKIAHTNEKVACTDGKLVLMEEKSCRKHQEILATSNQYLGKLEKQIDKLNEDTITRNQLDRLIEVNQADIAANRKALREIEIKQAVSWTKLSIVWVAITMLGIAALNFLIDLVKKRIE